MKLAFGLAVLLLASPAYAQYAAPLAVASSPSNPDYTFSCSGLNVTTTTTVVQPGKYAPYEDADAVNGEVFDARGVTLYGEVHPTDRIDYPVDIRTESDGGLIDGDTARFCWLGGAIIGTNDLGTSWTEMKQPNNGAIILKEGWATVDGARIYNIGDGIRPHHRDSDGDGLGLFTIRNVWMSHMRDDCIEVDSITGGTIEDSLFDGCYAFISATGAVTFDPDRTIIIRDSLVRLQEFPEPFGHAGEAACGSEEGSSGCEGHGALFKQWNNGPNDLRLEIYNTDFLIEDCASTQFSYSNWCSNSAGSYGGLSLLPERMDGCGGNTIYWLGPDTFPGDLTGIESCFVIKTDPTAWYNKRELWKARHGQIMRIPGIDG